MTAFGSPWADPPRTAAAIRAAVTAHTGSLAPVGEVPATDLAASVVAVDCWCLLTGADRLASAGRYGAAATDALVSAMVRAAGEGLEVPPDWDPGWGPTRGAGPLDVLHRRVPVWVRWIRSHLGDGAVPGVLRAAAWDLSAGADDPRIAAAVTLLVTAAELADEGTLLD